MYAAATNKQLGLGDTNCQRAYGVGDAAGGEFQQGTLHIFGAHRWPFGQEQLHPRQGEGFSPRALGVWHVKIGVAQ